MKRYIEPPLGSSQMTDEQLDASIKHRERTARWAARHDCFADLARHNLEQAQREKTRRTNLSALLRRRW